MHRTRNIQPYRLSGALVTGLVECPIHPHMRASDDNLAWRIDICNEYWSLVRTRGLNYFCDLRFTQPHDHGETVGSRTQVRHLFGA